MKIKHNQKRDKIHQELRKAFDANYTSLSLPEETCRYLWFHSIKQAIIDMQGCTLEPHHRELCRHLAFMWLTSQDCKTVCDYAGIDYNFLIDTVKKYLPLQTKKYRIHA